jgi:RNase P subunit RPR2
MSITEKKVEEQWSVCDKCDYDRGFHVSFEKNESYDVVLICPGCGQRYRINWKIHL